MQTGGKAMCCNKIEGEEGEEGEEKGKLNKYKREATGRYHTDLADAKSMVELTGFEPVAS